MAPIVSCALGFLYNKESAILFLLDKESFVEQRRNFLHLKKMKDFIEIYPQSRKQILNNNEDSHKLNDHQSKILKLKSFQNEDTRHESQQALMQGLFVCPITYKEMNGIYPFSYLKTCGHVFSNQALHIIEKSNSLCYCCNREYTAKDVIQLNPSAEIRKNLLDAIAIADKNSNGNTKAAKISDKSKTIKKRKQQQDSNAINPKQVKVK